MIFQVFNFLELVDFDFEENECQPSQHDVREIRLKGQEVREKFMNKIKTSQKEIQFTGGIVGNIEF